MALNITSADVEKLAGEVAELAHETKTEAIRRSLEERRARLKARCGEPRQATSLKDYFEQNVWPLIPAGEIGRTITREEEDQILGYGPKGY